MPHSASVARWKHDPAGALGSPWALLRKVDQSGGSGVDQGGSAVYHGHALLSSPSENTENVGEPRMPQLPAAGRTCPFIKLKEEKPCLPGAEDAGELHQGVVVAF